MSVFRSPLLLSIALSLSSAAPAVAQPVLIGITGNANAAGDPTSKIVDINPVTGVAANPRDTGIKVVGGIATQPATGEVFGLTTLASSPANSLIKVNPTTGSWSM